MIWIIGGTSEARKLIESLDDLKEYVLTIATEDGKEFFPRKNLFVGRLNKEEMTKFAEKNKVKLLIDLSHPYARVVSENAKLICSELGISYIRYARKRVVEKGSNIYLKSYEEAYEFLSKVQGRVLFTTGSKNIKDFEKVKGKNRFIYRILPALESMKICKENNIKMEDIIAILGPFSKDFNKAMIENYRPDYCVMKDSGQAGGTKEKIEACEELGVKAIVIGREDEDGISDLREIKKIILAYKM